MRKEIGIIVLLLSAACAWAVPARRGPRNVVQPDGSVITVYAHGDERFSWLTGEDGRWLERAADGFYRPVAALQPAEIQARRRPSPNMAPEEAQSAIPLNIAPRGLVILAEFKDVKFSTPKADIDTMLNGRVFEREYDYTYNEKSYHVVSSGSARQYFFDSSFGQYNPQFDVIGPVTVSKNAEYYGSNSDGKDRNVQEMIREACTQASKEGADFSLYDNDNDGYVDFVYVIYAGYGEADGGGENTIWPHKHKLGKTVKLNGKTVQLYACGCEMNNYSKQFYGIGLFCHEFGHVLGLPDIYETSGKENWKTLGMWDIMDYGPYNNDSNTPPSYSGYERFFLGWAKPRLLTDPENWTLGEILTTNEVLIISPDGKHNLVGNNPVPQTFYVLENRRQTGWNAFNPGEGLLITKVAYNYSAWRGNYVNDVESSMGIDIIEADGQAPRYPDDGWYGRPEDAFPAGADSYKAIENYPLTDIKLKNGAVSLKFMGGAASPVTEVNSVSGMTDGGKWLWRGRIYLNYNGHIYDILGNENHIIQR